jgi:hypothetical protein
MGWMAEELQFNCQKVKEIFHFSTTSRLAVGTPAFTQRSDRKMVSAT